MLPPCAVSTLLDPPPPRRVMRKSVSESAAADLRRAAERGSVEPSRWDYANFSTKSESISGSGVGELPSMADSFHRRNMEAVAKSNSVAHFNWSGGRVPLLPRLPDKL